MHNSLSSSLYLAASQMRRCYSISERFGESQRYLLHKLLTLTPLSQHPAMCTHKYLLQDQIYYHRLLYK